MENVPAGYVALDLVGFTDRGPYVDDATYMKNDLVHLKNMIWKCKVDNTTGIKPANNANWEVFIQSSTDMAGITAIDTSGVIGTAGQEVVSQDLIDAIADRVMTKILLKSDLTSQIVNDANKAASIAALFSVNETLKQTNSNFLNRNIKTYTSLAQLGITSSTAAVKQIVAAMPDNSIFVSTEPSISDKPMTTWGIIVIIRINASRWSAKWYSQAVGNDQYHEYAMAGTSDIGTSWKTIYSGN